MRLLLVFLLTLTLTLLLTPLQSFAQAAELKTTLPRNVLPLPAKNFLRLIKLRDQCRPRANELYEKLKAHGTQEGDVKIPSAESIMRSLKDSDECFNDLGKVYSIGSLALLSRANGTETNKLRDLTVLNGKSAIALGGIILANSDRFDFVSDKSRIDPTSIWFQERKPKILGSFDCNQNKMTIDLHQAPFDVAATAVHEMNHYFTNQEFPDFKIPDMKSFILVDETIAAIHAGYTQRAFNLDDEGKENTSFDIPGDLNFYDRHGLLNNLWNQRREMGFGGFYFYRIFLYKVLFDSGLSLPTYTESLFGLLNKSYFGGPLSADLKQHLLGNFLLDVIPFARTEWNQNTWSLIDWYSPWIHEVSDEGIEWKRADVCNPASFKDGFSRQLVLMKADGKNYCVNFAGLRSYFEYYAQDPNPLSPACRQFNEAVKRGELDDYIGTPRNPQLPGADGARPGSGDIQPGADGSRPESPLRMCIQIGDKL